MLPVLLFAATSGWAQTPAPAQPTAAADSKTVPVTSGSDADKKNDEVITLSPFEVSADNGNSYTASTTLAGNRLNTEVRDIGNAVTVITGQFLKDIGATDNQTLLQYTTSSEVGNVYGNFAGTGDASVLDESPHFINPNQNTRIRGLTAADNTRDFFLTDVPWEGYNVDGVDLQRGPNSILFGQGSPAGIINTRLKQASFKNSDEITFRVGSFGSNRATIDINRVLIKGELAFRIAAVRNDTEYKEDPAKSVQKRGYAAVRWEPGFLKKGSARTTIKADLEVGEVNSNNPRQLPPIDLITPWFYTGTYAGKDVAGNNFNYPNLNKLTLIPRQNEDDNTNLPNHGQNRPAHNGAPIAGTPNQYYQPWVGNFGNQFGNPTIDFNGDSSTAMAPYVQWEPQSNHGIGSNGAVDQGVGGIPFQRPAGIAPYAQFAVNAHLPYSDIGLYKDKSLTDPTVFDFYNKLLDGPNKKEWQNFRVYNITLDQTFFDDQVGFEGTYNKEWYKQGQLSLLTGDKQAIGIDFNSVYSDGSPAGINGQSGADGTPNPNVGRAYVSDTSQYGNSSLVRNRDTKRLTLFVDHDFSKGGSFIGKLIGRHIITGLLNSEKIDSDFRNWQRYGTDAAYEAFVNVLGDSPKLKFTANNLTPNQVIYIGPSLASRSTASGANLPNLTAVQTSVSGSIRTFDSTWNRSTNPADPNYVDPGAFWHNDYYPTVNPIDGTPFTAGNSTQSENPANYVGFRNVPITIIDSETSQANRNLLTHDARLTKATLDSKAFTWQGHFWDNFLVGTFGVRKDIAKSWAISENINSSTSDAYGHLSFDPNVYKLKDAPDNRIEVTSHAWTAVAHLNQLPKMDWLPIQVSVFYNRSTDFQPEAARVDLYGRAIGPPSGLTIDKGILLESKDGKYSFKINRYSTDVTGASTPTLGYSWFLGSSQAWAANWVNRFEFNWTGDTQANAVAVNDPTNSEYNYAQAPGETLAQAQAREQAAITAWRNWQKSVDPRFYAAWGINLNDHTKSVTATQPNGFAITEDSTSKGWEFEFNASPTKNWRLTFNAAKTDATRVNVGGPDLSAFMNAYANGLKNTALGDLRIWWGGAGNETTLQEWYSGNQPFGSQYSQVKQQEGTAAPELRKWRFNAITNYDFDRGILKDFSIGGGVRYQSDQIIGYAPLATATANGTYLDLSHPFTSGGETDYDIWVGYHRKLTHKVNWSVQLNIRNLFVGNKLIPITTEPDGSAATLRIRPPQVWELTNSFTF